MSTATILLIVAAVCLGLAAAGVQVGRLNLTGLGLLAWVLSLLV